MKTLFITRKQSEKPNVGQFLGSVINFKYILGALFAMPSKGIIRRTQRRAFKRLGRDAYLNELDVESNAWCYNTKPRTPKEIRDAARKALSIKQQELNEIPHR